MAYLSAIVTNIAIQLYGKPGVKLKTVQDFMPEWDAEAEKYRKPKQQSVEEMKEILYQIAGHQGTKEKQTRKTRTR